MHCKELILELTKMCIFYFWLGATFKSVSVLEGVTAIICWWQLGMRQKSRLCLGKLSLTDFWIWDGRIAIVRSRMRIPPPQHHHHGAGRHLLSRWWSMLVNLLRAEPSGTAAGNTGCLLLVTPKINQKHILLAPKERSSLRCNVPNVGLQFNFLVFAFH